MLRKSNIFKRYSSLILILTLVLNIFVGTFGYAENNDIEGYISMSVEAFTLGKGYIEEPIKIPFYKDDKLSDITAKFLGQNNYKYGGKLEQGFYITDIYDKDKNQVNIPKYIIDKAGNIDTNQEDNWIGQKNYTEESGWLYTANNQSPPVGMSDYNLKDGDVIRLQYSVIGYGSDIGIGWEENYIEQADKDKLTAKIAQINSSLDKQELLSNELLKQAYENSYKLNVNLESTQSEIDNSLKQLNYALDNKDKPIEADKTYKDQDLFSTWAVEGIEEATKKDIVNGSNGYFRPKDNIKRSEFTKIMVSALDLDINRDEENIFKDINKSDWFYPYVTASYKAGIVKGDGDKFKPNDNITREEMAAIIIRSLKLKDIKPNTVIEDIEQVSSWAKTEVETAVATGIITGSNNRFNPKAQATREMAAVVTIRGLDYSEKDQSNPKPEIPTDKNKDLTENIAKTAQFLKQTIKEPVVGSVGGEWTVLGLARSDEDISNNYYEKYYKNVVNTVKELMPEEDYKPQGILDRNKGTEHSRIILSLTAIGKDIRDVAGYDISEALADFDYVKKQGINGPIFALIALDSNNYEIPEIEGVKTQTTRKLLVDFILDREIEGGGWALGANPSSSDPDITAMAIQGLTPYYNSNNEVKKAVDRGLIWLSKAQGDNGGYDSWGTTNSESISQVIVALTGLGIDPDKDQRFIKNGNSPLDILLSYQAENGGFYHIKSGDIDIMATDQSMYAMVAYQRFINGQSRLYDMKDVK